MYRYTSQCSVFLAGIPNLCPRCGDIALALDASISVGARDFNLRMMGFADQMADDTENGRAWRIGLDRNAFQVHVQVHA